MTKSDLMPYLRAEVVDIRQPGYSIDDKMLVDTNILYFCYYDRSSQLDAPGKGPTKYQTIEYPSFLKKLLSSQTILFVHKIGLLEFANTVERAELQILYCKVNNVLEIGEDFKPKDLRRAYPQEYRTIQGRLVTYLHSIKKTFKLISNNSIDQFLADFLLEWQGSLADAGDAIMVAEAKLKGVNSGLSDDAYFATFKDIKLYTANDFAIHTYQTGHKN